MKRILFPVLAALALFAACEKSILPEDASYDQRNVVLRHFFYYDGVTMDTNKIFLLGNSEVRFQDIEVVFGQYYFTDHLDDTLTPNFKDTSPPRQAQLSKTVDRLSASQSMTKATRPESSHRRIGREAAAFAAALPVDVLQGISRLRLADAGELGA